MAYIVQFLKIEYLCSIQINFEPSNIYGAHISHHEHWFQLFFYFYYSTYKLDTFYDMVLVIS